MKHTFLTILILLTTGIVKSNSSQDSILSQLIINEILVNNMSLDNYEDSLIRHYGEKNTLVLDVKKHNDFIIKWQVKNRDISIMDTSYRYAYKLEGFDKDWIFSDFNTTEIRYSDLQPGSYRFLVRHSENGFWNVEPTEQNIILMPKWWQTWWARTLQILFVLISSILIFGKTISKIQLSIKHLLISTFVLTILLNVVGIHYMVVEYFGYFIMLAIFSVFSIKSNRLPRLLLLTFLIVLFAILTKNIIYTINNYFSLNDKIEILPLRATLIAGLIALSISEIITLLFAWIGIIIKRKHKTPTANNIGFKAQLSQKKRQ